MTATLPVEAAPKEDAIRRMGSASTPPARRAGSPAADVLFAALAQGAAWLTLALLAGIIGSLIVGAAPAIREYGLSFLWRIDLVCEAGIGRTFQIVKPFADMTVLENAMVGGFRGTSDRAQARARAARALRWLDMWPLRDRPASALTLPDRKRLEVARALATEPTLLLLDEVMAGLRPTETDQMVAAFKRLALEQGVTILLIEHVMRAVMALAGRVYVLHHGEIIASGTPQQVTTDARVLESYLGPGGH